MPVDAGKVYITLVDPRTIVQPTQAQQDAWTASDPYRGTQAPWTRPVETVPRLYSVDPGQVAAYQAAGWQVATAAQIAAWQAANPYGGLQGVLPAPPLHP